MPFVYSRDDLVQGYNGEEAGFFLMKRKGGGGGGRGGGGGSVSSGSSSSSSSSGSSSRGSGSSSSSSSSSSSGSGASRGFTPGTVSGGSRVYGSSTGRGISTPYTVSSGAFAGRQAGGGTRSNVYSGGGGYGSGYTSGYAGRGPLGGPVGGLGFPFIFWPVAFGGVGYAGYYGSRELNNDTERPGGGMTQYTLAPPANVSDVANNRFALFGDLNSVDSVFQTLVADCGVSSTLASNFTLNPNQTVAYYRGSSFALMLDGYSNGQPNITGTDGNSTDAVTQPLAPVPATVDTAYLNCLNSSIGTNVPLIDAATSGAASLAHVADLQFVLLLPALLVALLLGAL